MRRAQNYADDAVAYAAKLLDQARAKTISTLAAWSHRGAWQDAIDALDVAADALEERGNPARAETKRQQANMARELVALAKALHRQLPRFQSLAHSAYAREDEAAHAELVDRLEEIGLTKDANGLRYAYRRPQASFGFRGVPVRADNTVFDRTSYRETLYTLGIFERPRSRSSSRAPASQIARRRT